VRVDVSSLSMGSDDQQVCLTVRRLRAGEQLQAIIEQKKAQEQAEQRRQEEHKRSLDPSRQL
jgi:hypothetical protein